MKKSHARLLKAAYEQDLETFEKLLPAFKCTVNARRIDRLLDKIFHTEDDMWVDYIPAEITLSMLHMLIDADIVLHGEQQFNDHQSICADTRYILSSTVTSNWILHECHYRYHYTPKQCMDVAVLIWVIGGGLLEPYTYLYDLFGFAVDESIEPLIHFCLEITNFERLDTHDNSALLRILIAHEDDSWEVCEKAVRFALDNGADINHKLSNGFSVLDAVAHNCRCPAFAYDLLVSLGAKQEGA